MNKNYTRIIIFICLLIPGIAIKAQVVTVTNPTFTTPALAATYTSLANAVTALNGITAISGVVTITLNPGNPQTAPAGGYVINFTSPTTAAKRVIITGSNNTILSNGSLVAGSLTDAFFKVVGVDFLTIQNFAMQENPPNTTSAVATNNMTEWGVALLYASATNGAQNNTIQNNTITLNKNYSNTFGIYSNTRHTATTINITADVTSTAGANSNNNIYGNAISNVNMGIAFIGSGDAAFMDLGNDIGGASVATANTITNWGGIAAGSNYISNDVSCYGIFINNQKNENISFNTITSATVSGTPVAMRGIYKDYDLVPTGTFTSNINDNVIRINHNFSSGVLEGIRSDGITTALNTATININNNRFQNMSVLAPGSTSSISGIRNNSQCGVLNINSNIFRGNNSASTTGSFIGISAGFGQISVNINNNQLGDASGDAITFSTATSGILYGISGSAAPGASLSISGNNFKGFNQTIAGSGQHVYIGYSHDANTAITDNINSNTFTNLVANTSDIVTFILKAGVTTLLAGATENCNNNSIVGSFSKPVSGGWVSLFGTLGSSQTLVGNTMIQTGNNFSNITLAGATVMEGWDNKHGGASGPAKTINGNTFSNWTCGSGDVYVIQSDFSDNNTTISNNTISNISASGGISGIFIGRNNKGALQTCSGNIISGLTSAGGAVYGIEVGTQTTVNTFNVNNNTISSLSSGGTNVTAINVPMVNTANVFKNKIYDLSVNNVNGEVYGINIYSTSIGTYNLSNNYIGDLRANITNKPEAIFGINLASPGAGTAYSVFYNTVYINALAGGTNFGTSALKVASSVTAANGALSLRNNILVNTSIAKGTGLTVSYRRTSTALNNFAASSNNNIFYAGTPATGKLIFYDGTNSDQTLAAYKTRVGPTRDAASFTELPPFLSTVGSSANFLHLDPFISTQAESGAVNISTYTDDYDGNIRQGNAGYVGLGTAPDIGADEMNSLVNAVVVVTNYTLTTPNLAETYPSLASAIADLNNITAISGAVTITLMPGHPQTAPAGGYAIFFSAPTTNTNNVTITGSNNTITANGSLVPGSLTDAIFKVVGVDFLTIQNFIMQENAANTTTAAASNNMTEWGVALLYVAFNNGSQNNTIQNNSISLNKTYSNTFGIYSNTRHTATTINITADVTSTAGANSNNNIYNNAISNVNMGIAFIGSGNAAFMDIGNDIGGASVTTANTITNWGGIAAASNYISNTGSCYGIFLNNQKNETVSFNTITSATVSGTSVAMRGVFKTYSVVPTGTFTSSIANNVIRINHSFTSGVLDGIRSEGISAPLATATININSNRFQTISVLAASSSTTIVGITNTSQCGVLNINNNIFRGTNSTATTGGFTAISNTGAVQTTLNINGNQVGDVSGNAITFSVATSGALTGITCPTIAAGAAMSISNNNFQGFVQNVPGTGGHTYISYTHSANSATTDNINNNTFTNLVANTSNGVSFIIRSGTMAALAGATDNCNNNRIVTAFSKPVAGGIVELYFSGSSSTSGNFMIQTGNDFSNITLTGATVMNGWSVTEGGLSGPAKTISNNIFTNWACGTSAVTVLSSNFGDNNTIISDNTISAISAAAAITAISLGNSNKGTVQTCSGNTIADLTSTGGSVLGIVGGATTVTTFNINNNTISGLSSSNAGSGVTGIRMLTASTANVFKNKIYDLSASNATGTVSGLDVFGTALGTYNINNNLVGDLRADLTNSTVAIRGINFSAANAGTAYNVFYNTVYLNALAGGTNFGTSALSVTVNATAANGALSLRNNILVNTSLAKGTGLTVAYRRSGTALNNFANSSNNNIFYAGTPSATNLVFSDGTNFDQTLAGYQTRVAPRDAASFTELPPFLSTVGSSVNFLHIDPAATTQAESGAVNIATYTDDYDGDIRQGNPGYTGVGTAPDIGADEISNETNPPVITYTTISSPICIFSGMTISGVVINDSSGVPLTGALKPRIYFRKNAGTWFSAGGINTGGSAKNSTWSFTITEASMGGVVVGDVISYYIIAQDIMPTPNVGANPGAGLVAANVNTVTTAPTTPNTYTISGSLNGLYTVGVGGNFTTLTSAVAAYNSTCSLSGPVIFELTDNLYNSPKETFPININEHVDASALKTLTIRPSATATPVITGASASQIINLNGAKFIVFNGRRGGIGLPKKLTLTNTGTGITLLYSNDAQFDTIRNCVIRGMNPGTNSGTIVFGAANASGTGNDNNTIDSCEVRDATGQSANGIYSSGTATRENSNNVITNNDIFNYYHATNSSAGILIAANSSDWVITRNELSQTPTYRIYTAANVHYGINISSGSGYLIQFNNIGNAGMLGNPVDLPGFPFSYSPGTGVPIRYIGIFGSFSGITNSIISSNSIEDIKMFTSSGQAGSSGILCGINVESGKTSISNNYIGTIFGGTYVATTTSGGAVVGIRVNSSEGVKISGNQIGGFFASGTANNIAAGFTGISLTGSAIDTVDFNRIGSYFDPITCGYAIGSGGLLSSAVELLSATSGLASMTAIECVSTGNKLVLKDNVFSNWTTSGTAITVNGIASSGNMTGANASVEVLSNNFNELFPDLPAFWIKYFVASTAALSGIKVLNTGASVHKITQNEFANPISYNSISPNSGVIDFISLSGATNAGNITTISQNIFRGKYPSFGTDTFRLKTTNAINFISTNYDLASTAQRIITSNSCSGLINDGGTVSGDINIIHSTGASAAGGQVTVSNNSFRNISASVAPGFTISGYWDEDGGLPVNGYPVKTITGNSFRDWVCGNAAVKVIRSDMGDNNSNLSTNTISGISSAGAITAIHIGPLNKGATQTCSGNTISAISSAGGDVFGIVGGSTAVTNFNITSNKINGLLTTAPSSSVAGIRMLGAVNANLSKNKIFDISGNNATSTVYGIDIPASVPGTYNISNNLVGDLRSTLSGIPFAIKAINLSSVESATAYNFFNNTVYLNASSTGTNFGSAGIVLGASATAANGNATLRNNIVTNTSTSNGTGLNVAYMRSGTALNNFAAGSNNNLFYAGTASSTNLIFSDGTNNDQTIADYLTRVGPSRDAATISEPVVFISTNGIENDFLHLDPLYNCNLNDKGDNTGLLLNSDIDGETRSVVTPFKIDIGADEVKVKNIFWTGGGGYPSWQEPFNWSPNIVPNLAYWNVTILSSAFVMPEIEAGESFQVHTITIQNGASLTNRGTLRISNMISPGSFPINNINGAVVEGSIELNAPCAVSQSLSGNNFVDNSINDLTISSDVSLYSFGGQVNVAGELSFGTVTNKTLTTNNLLTLKSTINATANVGDLTNNNIVGQATVERYIHTGTTGGAHTKTWQFLSTPTTGQTIRQAWQENGTTPAGFGTIITGTGTGFDITTALPSLKFFNDVAVNWTAVTNTNNALLNKLGYMLFVRGDRTVNTSGATPNNTVLRSKGTLFQPSNPPASVAVAANKFQTFGNPYASRIEFSKVRAISTGINDVFYVWDPKLAGNYNVGGYQTITGVAGYVPTVGTPPTGNPATVYYPAGVPAPFIESGQAVFVKGNGTGGNVNFNETVKVSGSRLVNRPGTGNNELANRGFIFASLFTNTDNIADGNIVAFEEGLGNELNELDALKILNGGENFGIRRSDSLLAVEARDQVMKNDTIFYHLQNLKKLPYQFRFAPVNMRREGLHAYLIDRFTNSSTDVSLNDSSFINFNITEDVRSQAADRFILVFKKVKKGPVKPITPKEASEQARGQNNEITETKPTVSTIAVYPNPVVDQQINIRFSNMAKGNYRIELSNKQGQVVYKGEKYIDQQNTTHTIRTNNVLAPGSYQLSVTAENSVRMVEQVVVK